MSDFRILVAGAGATGGFFGGRLLQAGRDVTFLVRPGRAKQLRDRGLRITGLGEDTVLAPELVEAGDIAGTYDLVLFTVKAAGIAQAIEDIAPAVGPHTLILPVLNGMRHIDALVERFGERAVLGGVVKVITTLNAEGDVVRLGDLQSLVYGARTDPAPPALAEADRVLSGAGFDAGLSGKVVEAMWSKWVFIASIGAVNSLLRAEIRDVVAVAGGKEFALAVVAEAAAVADAAGYPVPPAELDMTRVVVTNPATPGSSLYRDLISGNPVEAEQIFGDLTARGARLGVATPLLDLVILHLRVHQHRVMNRPTE